MRKRVVRFGYAPSTALYLAPVVPFWLARITDPVRREDHARARAEDAYAIGEPRKFFEISVA
jgi:hypothetical protein